MRRDRIKLGQDYRLRWSRSGLYRVRALAWRTEHHYGKRPTYLVHVEWREESSGTLMSEVASEWLTPAELLAPWDDTEETDRRERVERLRSAAVELRDAFASYPALIHRGTVEVRHGRVVVELDAIGGETLARLIEKEGS